MESKPPEDGLRRLVREALVDLADVERTIALGVIDEAALQLDDCLAAYVAQVPPSVAVDRMLELEGLLEVMSGEHNARLWEPEAMSTPQWRLVRRLAAEALAALDAEVGEVGSPRAD